MVTTQTFMPSTLRDKSLSPSHYAYEWTNASIKTPDQITKLGIQFVSASSSEKQDILLEIIKAFHMYTLKYTRMISFGQLTVYKGHANKDSTAILKMFLSKGMPVTNQNLLKVSRTLHLAFKNQTADEIYNILSGFIIRAVNKYDPSYTDKVKQTVEAVNERIKKGEEFKPESLGLSFDPAPQLHWLVKRGHLEIGSTLEPKKNPIFRRPEKGTAWPPGKKILKAKPIGLTYHVQRLFRVYLQRYIESVMSEIETKEGMMQLTAITNTPNSRIAGNPSSYRNSTGEVISSQGNFVSTNGVRFAADVGLQNTEMDLGTMGPEWVQETKDPLFRNMTKEERQLLYLVFTKELTWKQIASTMQQSVRQVRTENAGIMAVLRSKVLG